MNENVVPEDIEREDYLPIYRIQLVLTKSMDIAMIGDECEPVFHALPKHLKELVGDLIQELKNTSQRIGENHPSSGGFKTIYDQKLSGAEREEIWEDVISDD